RPEFALEIEILELQNEYLLDFAGDSGLIPNIVDGPYFSSCMNLYLFGTGVCEFGGARFSKVMNAYLFPIE
ncbi:unnamed protein product, partial [marine sediment metagenome]